MKKLKDISYCYICSLGIVCIGVEVIRAQSGVSRQCLLVNTSPGVIKHPVLTVYVCVYVCVYFLYGNNVLQDGVDLLSCDKFILL